MSRDDPVGIDIEAVDAELRFDLNARQASAVATVRFSMAAGPGLPVFDLRQEIDSALLDGAVVAPGDLGPVDLGGGLGADMRVLDRSLEAGSTHELQLRYPLGTPDAADALPVGWDGGSLLDLWMSDLHPGRYLEMWIPANLCHDRFALTVDLAIVGEPRFEVLTNGSVSRAGGRIHVAFPDHFTSLSPMLVIVPAEELVTRRVSAAGIEVTVAAMHTTDVDVDAVSADAATWITGNVATYGAYNHGSRFTAYIWDSTRGMEYDGATTASVGALEHEIFHSWFGRGIKPASQNDGWIDEAYTTWSTASGRYEGERFAVVPLNLDEEPVVLSPAHQWSRVTPTDSYRRGAQLFAGIAALAGGAEPLRRSMAAFYGANAGQLVTTTQLEDHLAAVAGDDVHTLFHRYVYGRD